MAVNKNTTEIFFKMADRIGGVMVSGRSYVMSVYDVETNKCIFSKYLDDGRDIVSVYHQIVDDLRMHRYSDVVSGMIGMGEHPVEIEAEEFFKSLEGKAKKKKITNTDLAVPESGKEKKAKKRTTRKTVATENTTVKKEKPQTTRKKKNGSILPTEEESIKTKTRKKKS